MVEGTRKVMIKIRKIRPSDYIKAGNVIKRAIRVSWGGIYPEKLLDEFCKKYNLNNFKKKAKEIEFIVAVENDNILGIIGMKENALRTFYVDPKHQGKGIGSALFRTACSRMDEQRTLAYLETDKLINVRLYRKLGFETVAETELLGVTNWLMMRRPKQ